MKSKLVPLVISLLICGFAISIHSREPSPSTKEASLVSQPAPTPWPDLSTIKIDNKDCGPSGSMPADEEHGRRNALKNRFRLPDGPFEPMSFDALLALNQGHIKGKKIIDFPTVDDPNNARAVSITGYVLSVFAAGCSQGESCNCKTMNKSLCDAHINVLPTKHSNKQGGRNTYVVEVTQRARLLAKQGLLESNIGKDWSTPVLQNKLIGHRVRFSGYLFFDADHFGQAWQSDPNDKVHKPGQGDNFRQTCWEVHPVMKIEVLN